jgi:hypothetical protein
MNKIYAFRGQKGKNRLSEPKNGIYAREFYGVKKKYTFGGQNGENKP